MVTIIVGHQKQPFRMHKCLLCNTPSYFDVALNGNFKEAQEQQIEMLEEDTDMFRHFQFWVYCREIYVKSDKECDVGWKQLIDLFTFGEARGIPDLANAAIDGLIEKQSAMQWRPSEHIRYVYDNTTPKSPLRQLLIDFTIKPANFSDDSWFSEKIFEWYTKEFLFDLAVAQWEVRKGMRSVLDDFKAKRCSYHVVVVH